MAIPHSRDEFKEYCLRKLGEPVINVQVAVEQVDDRIDEALYKFYSRHYDAVEPYLGLVVPTDTDIANGYVVLPSDIVSVTDMYRPSRSGGLFSFEYRAFINSTFGISGDNTAGLSNWFINQMNISLINQLFFPQRGFAFNQITHKLIVPGGLRDLVNTDGGVIVRGYRKVLGEASTENPTNSTVENIWKNNWLQKYATALIKQQWGTNLSKFSGVQLIGGVTLNGDLIKQEASQEIQELEEELKSGYELPVDFFMY